MSNRILEVDPDALRESVLQFSRERSPLTRGLTEVAFKVEEKFQCLGYQVSREPVPWEGGPYWNLVAQGRYGKDPEGPFLLVGAHYDAVEGSPGADDNATGLAVLLEVARVLRDHPALDQIRFVAFTLEEWGMIGSTSCATGLKRQGVRLIGMISLEMLGFTGPTQSYPAGLAPFYPEKGNFIGVGANWGSRRLLSSFVRGMRQVKGLDVETISLPGNGGLVPAIRLSDHAPFWDLGFPALLVTDTSFYRNPHYHTASDTPDTLDFPFLTRVAQALVHGVLESVAGGRSVI